MGSDDLSTKQIFELLANDRRRFTVFYLGQRGTDSPESLGSIAKTVAAWENDVPVADVSRRQRKRVYDSLQQHHVQAFADQGIVTYDPKENTLALTETGDLLLDYLEFDQSKSIPWNRLNLGLGLIGVIIAVLHIGDIMTVVPPLVTLFGISIGIAVASLMQVWGVPGRLGDASKPPTVRE